MIGLLVVAHSGLAAELVRAAEMVVGPIPLAEAVGIEPTDSGEAIHKSIDSALRKVAADGAIIMTDMFGGTPSNLSLSFLEEGRVEVLTGVNLPMVLEFASKREKLPVSDLAKTLQESGRQSISVAGDYLKR
jgi:mannose PTS system EIIA component